MEQIENIPDYVREEEKNGRKDIRNWQTVTIDGEDAKDLDDAVKLAKSFDPTINERAVGIASSKTLLLFRTSPNVFEDALNKNSNSPEVKNINDVDEGHVIKFIQSRAEEAYSPSTYSKDMAALNKIFNKEVTKSDCDDANRSYKTIENNRKLQQPNEKINFDNYKSEISMIQATGIRRSSLETITKDSFKYDTNGTPTHICVTEKGGRYREAEIRESYREEIREIVEKAGNERVFEHIPNRLPTHRFRQEYAEKLYEEKLEKIENTEDREQYRGYDREILREVSENLGHNREDVIVYHYLYVR